MQRTNAKSQVSTERTVRYLVVGYNQCAFTVQGTHPEYLSIPLIKFASEGEYAGFYACTHRCHELLQKQKNDIAQGKIVTQPGKPDCTYPCYKISVSFVKATQIPNEGVSTLDDIKFPTAGAAYPKILYKIEHNDAPDLTTRATWEDINLFGKDKNFQLLQIAKQLAAKHPDDAEVTLTFVDDKLANCKAAAEHLVSVVGWPNNVRLNVYRHHAESDTAPVELVAAGLLKKQSLFTVKAVPEQRLTRSMTRNNAEAEQSRRKPA